MNTINIYKNIKPQNSLFDNKNVDFTEVKMWIKRGVIFKHFFKYHKVVLHVFHINILPKPFITCLIIFFLGRKEVYIQDNNNHSIRITTVILLKLFFILIVDFFNKFFLLRKIKKDIYYLNKLIPPKKNCNLSDSPLYLRTDLVFGLLSGGSVGHISGVLNNLGKCGGQPIFVSSDKIPLVRDNIPCNIILPDKKFEDFKEIPSLNYNYNVIEQTKKIIHSNDISFIYQRYSVNNFSGAKLATELGIPFVLEYNGSEIWISKNWGHPLKYQKLSKKIEMVNFKLADCIVVVSEPLYDELVERGVEADKIIINPNGVNQEIYKPTTNGDQIRSKFNLKKKKVFGFIGTFGQWHGIEVLSDAIIKFYNEFPQYHDQVAFLLIGNGVLLPTIKNSIEQSCSKNNVIFTGAIPQHDGPMYLAACDYLVSPHVPNADGSKFFGSPTKLFEYMSMGKPIIASNLDQIGDILEHHFSAYLTRPGNVSDLVKGFYELLNNSDLCSKISKNARQEVVKKYTWEIHTAKIITKLKERVTVN